MSILTLRALLGTLFISSMHIRNVHAAVRSQRIVNKYNSVHSAGIDEVHDMPMNIIIRPIPPVLEERKVLSLMATLRVRT
jgi:hypothetical protein